MHDLWSTIIFLYLFPNRYNFTFSEPKETVWVQSTMTKLSTNEVWFNVNFELNRIPFTPLNLLYVLLYYPLYTRMVQVLIHYEAVKLFLKGVPTFNHPKGTPVEFGFGITDKKLIVFVGYVNKLVSRIFGKSGAVGEKVEWRLKIVFDKRIPHFACSIYLIRSR